jgi:hypothetical protein
MKELMATLVLLCLSTTVLAHDIYSNLRDKAGHYCCNGQDCRPRAGDSAAEWQLLSTED